MDAESCCRIILIFNIGNKGQRDFQSTYIHQIVHQRKAEYVNMSVTPDG